MAFSCHPPLYEPTATTAKAASSTLSLNRQVRERAKKAAGPTIDPEQALTKKASRLEDAFCLVCLRNFLSKDNK
jgi:hypothetical protein